MNSFKKFLYKKRILKLSKEKVSKWVKQRNADNLIFAALFGLFDVRKTAIEALGTLQHAESIDLIELLMDDPIHSVSEAAMQAAGDLTRGLDDRINKKISLKKQFWKEEREKAGSPKRIKSSTKNVDDFLRNKRSPSQKINARLKEQRNTNHPPFSF